MDQKLSSLPEGGAGMIAGLDQGGELRGRLMDLGFTPGAGVECLFAAPSGDPRAYLVRGAVIALRNCDAAGIVIEQQ